MRRSLDFLLSGLCTGTFFLLLGFFQPVQWVAYHVFGIRAHRHSVEILNACLVATLWFTGARIRFRFLEKPPRDRRILFLSNHQSMHDIPALIWYLRKYNPVFVSKQSLGKGIPSISFNLQKSGAALIDRKNSKQAITELVRLAAQVVEKQQSVILFPEGTRSQTEELIPFKIGGIATLVKKIPDAWIVPIAISGNATMNPKGLFPLKSFSRLSWTVLPGFPVSGRLAEEISQQVVAQIDEYRSRSNGHSKKLH